MCSSGCNVSFLCFFMSFMNSWAISLTLPSRSGSFCKKSSISNWICARVLFGAGSSPRAVAIVLRLSMRPTGCVFSRFMIGCGIVIFSFGISHGL